MMMSFLDATLFPAASDSIRCSIVLYLWTFDLCRLTALCVPFLITTDKGLRTLRFVNLNPGIYCKRKLHLFAENIAERHSQDCMSRNRFCKLTQGLNVFGRTRADFVIQ